MERINLVDLDFNSFSPDEKRLSFITMDIVMKNLHRHNKTILSFNPQDIYYDKDTTLFEFDKVTDITPYIADSKEKAFSENVVGLSTLAFCSYLKTYDPKDGLLNNTVIAKEFSKFTDIFNPDDVDYYKNVLVDSYEAKTMPEPLYYSDAIIKKEQERKAGGNSNGKLLSYATAAGKATAKQYENPEAAFSSQFFLACMVACIVMASIGFIIYFLNI